MTENQFYQLLLEQRKSNQQLDEILQLLRQAMRNDKIKAKL
jgi:hypothetical protein